MISGSSIDGEAVARKLSALDERTASGEQALAAVDELTLIERAASAARARYVNRVEETKAFVDSGHRDISSWAAVKTGVTRYEAAADIETAKAAESMPGVRDALATGELSLTQAAHVSRAVTADPSSEQRLLGTAKTSTVESLRRDCRDVVNSSGESLKRYDGIRSRRFFRHWTESSGAFRFEGSVTPEDGGRLLAALKPHATRVFAEARRAGIQERQAVYDADAFMNLIGSKSQTTSGAKALVQVRVDHAALVRGHTEDGEQCEIEGVGALPVAVANAMLSDAVLRVLVTKGQDVVGLSSDTRTLPPGVKKAVTARDTTCVVPFCDAREHLEFDHNVGYVVHGPGNTANINRLCRWHHFLKTCKGYRLVGKTGSWKFLAPGSAEEENCRSG